MAYIYLTLQIPSSSSFIVIIIIIELLMIYIAFIYIRQCIKQVKENSSKGGGWGVGGAGGSILLRMADDTDRTRQVFNLPYRLRVIIIIIF